MSKERLGPKSHTKKGTIIYQVKKINEKIDEGNFKLALKMIRDIIGDYPNDYGLLRTLIRVYATNAMYDDALDLISKLDEEHIFIKKLEICLIKNDFNEVKRLYETYYDQIEERRYTTEQINILYYIVRGYLGLAIDEYEFNKLPYGLKQGYAYSKDRAMKHIMERHVYPNDDEEQDEEQALFSENVDVQLLFEMVDVYIKDHIEKLRLISNSMHLLIKYRDAGVREQGKKDYIEVIGKIGTGEILTMYPCKERKNEAIEYEEILRYYSLKNGNTPKKLTLQPKKCKNT